MIQSRIAFLVCLLMVVFSVGALAASPTGGVLEPFNPSKTNALTITSPQGGESWQGGIERTITWKYNPTVLKATSVKILLLKGNTVATTITSNTAIGSHGQGSFKWSTLNVAQGNDYRIKIVENSPIAAGALSGRTVPSYISGYFAIEKQAKIEITFPQNIGAVVVPGQSVHITWHYTGDIGNTLYLRLIHASDPPRASLFDVLVNAQAPAGSGGQGSYDWVIPTNLPSSSTYFFDIGCEYAGVGANGKMFTIKNSKN